MKRNFLHTILFVILSLTFWAHVARAEKFFTDSIPQLPDLIFKQGAKKLSKANKQTLDSVFNIALQTPDFSLMIFAPPVSCDPDKSHISWVRANNVINYLVAKGLKTEKLIFSYGSYENNWPDCFKFGFTEDRVTTEEPPHPNLRKRN
jgi:hypothetical protein